MSPHQPELTLDGLECDDSDSPAIGLFPPGVFSEQMHEQMKIAPPGGAAALSG